MLIALALTTSLAAASAGLLIKDSGLTAAAKDASIEDAIRAGSRDNVKARKALELVLSSSDATPVQAWRALKGVAKHDASVQAKLDAMVPALPFTAATGAQAKLLNGSFERALVDSGALPITADPSRRKGELKVSWTMRMVDDSSSKERAWSIDATATLSPNDIAKGAKIGAVPLTVKTKTLVKGATAEKAALAGMGDAADDLVKAVLLSMARDATGAPVAQTFKASPRSLEKVAALRGRAADGDKKSQAVIDSFPARVSVNVEGRGDVRVWTRTIEAALVGVSADALPLRSDGNAEHTMRVTVEVEENGGNVLAAGTVRRYTLKSKAEFIYDDDTVLATIHKVTLSMGSTPEEAANAGAEKTARALYEAMLDEVVALRHRRVASR